MILIAIGANLPSAAGPPLATCKAALNEFSNRGIEQVSASSWYETPAWPPSDQPNFINGVVAVKTDLSPGQVLAVLHDIEAAYGRTRAVRNEARSLDLDLIAYESIVQIGPPALPHPRMADRIFVLAPLCDFAPNWIHPVTNAPASALLAKIQQNQSIKRID